MRRTAMPVFAAHSDAAPAHAETETVTEAPAKPAKADKPVKAAKAKPAKKAATANGNANGKHEVKAKPAKAAKAAKPVKAKAKGERKRDPAKLDQWGFHKDSIKAKAAAIYAKGKGATLQEVKEVVGSIQFNLLKELEEQGHTVDRTDVKTDKGRVVTRYKLRPKE